MQVFVILFVLFITDALVNFRFCKHLSAILNNGSLLPSSKKVFLSQITYWIAFSLVLFFVWEKDALFPTSMSKIESSFFTSLSYLTGYQVHFLPSEMDISFLVKGGHIFRLSVLVFVFIASLGFVVMNEILSIKNLKARMLNPSLKWSNYASSVINLRLGYTAVGILIYFLMLYNLSDGTIGVITMMLMASFYGSVDGLGANLISSHLLNDAMLSFSSLYFLIGILLGGGLYSINTNPFSLFFYLSNSGYRSQSLRIKKELVIFTAIVIFLFFGLSYLVFRWKGYDEILMLIGIVVYKIISYLMINQILTILKRTD